VQPTVWSSSLLLKKLDESRQRIADFARGARQHSFSFHDMNGKGRAAHIGPAQPAAMNLISLAVDKDMPELGRTLPAAAERDGSLGRVWPGANAGTAGAERGSSRRGAGSRQHRPSNTRSRTGRRTAGRAQPRERHRVVHRLRHDRAPRSREPNASDLGTYRPDRRANEVTRPVPLTARLATLAEVPLFKRLAFEASHRLRDRTTSGM
jgi:hypothetical protein